LFLIVRRSMLLSQAPESSACRALAADDRISLGTVSILWLKHIRLLCKNGFKRRAIALEIRHQNFYDNPGIFLLSIVTVRAKCPAPASGRSSRVTEVNDDMTRPMFFTASQTRLGFFEIQRRRSSMAYPQNAHLREQTVPRIKNVAVPDQSIPHDLGISLRRNSMAGRDERIGSQRCFFPHHRLLAV